MSWFLESTQNSIDLGAGLVRVKKIKKTRLTHSKARVNLLK
jgi:hypothetical protein